MRFDGSRRFDGSALSPETDEMNWFEKNHGLIHTSQCVSALTEISHAQEFKMMNCMRTLTLLTTVLPHIANVARNMMQAK